MFILTFITIVLIISCGQARCIAGGPNANSNNCDPFLYVPKDLDGSPNDDVTRWVRQLHLQQCVSIEIGERFCALFVELRSIPSGPEILDSSSVGEFFLGSCHCVTLHSWDLCSFELMRHKKVDCNFAEATSHSNTSARVHRRLCDVPFFGENVPGCNSSILLAGHRLHKMTGFPTCILNPLPDSICSPRGVCGIAQCSATTIIGLHTPQHVSNCHQTQPFCEEIGPWTPIPAEINSLWPRWTFPNCNNTCGRGNVVAIASFHDQSQARHRMYRAGIVLVSPNIFEGVFLNSLSMMKSVNFSSCLDSFGKCYCEVNTVDGILRAARFTEPCISTEECTQTDAETFTLEGELDPSNIADFDEIYEDVNCERFEVFEITYSYTNIHSQSNSHSKTHPPIFSESMKPSQRRLLRVYSPGDEYGLRDNWITGENLKKNRGYRPDVRSRFDDDFDYNNDDEDEENGNSRESSIVNGAKVAAVGEDDDDNDDDDDKDDDEDEDEEEVNQSESKRIREARSDYAAIAFEGKRKVGEFDREGAMQIASADEDCDDDSTEPLRYYDYVHVKMGNGVKISVASKVFKNADSQI
ncbi:hypothetical protein WN55_06672 [Dufourea novaeangliae]|uniref:DUF4789 domain-containing protein n=1 Tax=Dufourea novaeangliae TaxID=178035 RepID=A0A154P224_DUFNO|nr:hypothetical protein WN55_06672 [Dufourea novaeangliae]